MDNVELNFRHYRGEFDRTGASDALFGMSSIEGWMDDLDEMYGCLGGISPTDEDVLEAEADAAFYEDFWAEAA